MAQKIIIDTDPGVDDAMAIFFSLQSPELEVLGVTAVFGNGDIATIASNAVHVLETVGWGYSHRVWPNMNSSIDL